MSGTLRVVARFLFLLFVIGVAGELIPGRTAVAEVQGSVGVTAGYRQDELDWNIGGYVEDPYGGLDYVNVLSELAWRDLEVWQLGMTGSVEVRRSPESRISPFVKAAIAYGWIVDGRNRDSDYLGDNRTLEFSRSDNNADDGNVIDLSVGIGGKFHIMEDRGSITPLLGFSWYAQDLVMRDGTQTVSAHPGVPPLGPFSGLDSSYDTQWYGPWIGLDATATLTQAWSLTAGVELHQAYYRAEADWNLRSDLAHPKSFEHKADGYGVIVRVGGRYAVTPRLSLTLDADWRSFTATDGTDTIYFTDGTAALTPLNDVNWESRMLVGGLLYHF